MCKIDSYNGLVLGYFAVVIGLVIGWFITDEDADSCLTASTGILKFEEVVE